MAGIPINDQGQATLNKAQLNRQSHLRMFRLVVGCLLELRQIYSLQEHKEINSFQYINNLHGNGS